MAFSTAWSRDRPPTATLGRPESSCLSDVIAPCMRRLRSFMSTVVATAPSPGFSGPFPVRYPVLADSGEVTLATQDGLERTGLADRKNDDRHVVLPGKRERRRIHDFQVAIERFLVGEPIIAFRRRIPLGIGGIGSVHVGRLEHGIAAHLGGAEDRRCVGLE